MSFLRDATKIVFSSSVVFSQNQNAPPFWNHGSSLEPDVFNFLEHIASIPPKPVHPGSNIIISLELFIILQGGYWIFFLSSVPGWLLDLPADGMEVLV